MIAKCAVLYSIIFITLTICLENDVLGERREQRDFAFLRNQRVRRAAGNVKEMTISKSYCNNTPCGWMIYNPVMRTVEYFMKNTCECPESYKCIRTDHDLSVSAYVYHCLQNTTTDIKSSKDANGG